MASNILSSVTAANAAIEFDAANKKHRAAYAYFTSNKRWPEGVRFRPEWPSTSVVSTVESKLAMHAIRTELKELQESVPAVVAA